MCSSEFVSNRWITYVYDEGNLFTRTDFRATATCQLQLLASFCQLSRQTVNDALSKLTASDYIDAQLSTLSTLHERIQITIREFQLTTPKSFVSSLDLIRESPDSHRLDFVSSTSF